MASAYQPTTEHRESQESIGVTCNPARWSGRKKKHDLPKVHVSDPSGSESKDQGESHPRLFASCMKPQRTTSVAVTPSGSIGSLASPANEYPDDTKGSTSKLERAKTIKKKILKSTEQFFGLCDDQEEQSQLERKWTQRKRRHYGKRYGGFADVVEDVVDASRQRRLPSVASVHSTTSSQHDPTLVRTRSRRKSVASMAWKQLKHKAIAGTLVAEASKAPPMTSVPEGGRSFCPAAIAEPDEFDETDAAIATVDVRGSKEFDDEVFFDFISERARLGKKLTPLPPIDEAKDVFEEHKTESDEEKEPLTPKVAPAGGDEVDTAPWLGPVGAAPNVRGKRMAGKPEVTNANRRQYGKGLVGRWMNRTIKRKRLSSTVRKQIEDLSDHRPYFTYWVSFVQLVVLIVTLAVYGFAPIGFTFTERNELISKSRQGTLVPEYLQERDLDNFWIGPNHAALIHLGAKFAPCMRHDKLLTEALERERYEEVKSGCCIKTDGSGCIQSSPSNCSHAFTNFQVYSKGNKSRAVCGQDPQLCQDPPSVKPYEWNLWDITKWPICKKTNKNVSAADFPHMTCEVTGRPCCVGTQAQCIIVSREECEFRRGYFHENATLCSQVNCLKTICGMIPFIKPKVADQVYRLWMALFLHAGVIHLACTLVFNFTILRDLEKLAGWIRITIIYIFSGIGGYLISAILIPYQVEVGPSGSMFGIIACLFVELIQSWQIIKRPLLALLKLCAVVLLLLLVGLLPYVDNFAHMAGFVFGFFLAFIFLPYITFGEWDKRRKRIQILIAFAIVIILYIVGFIIFLNTQTATCVGCEYLNCLPFTVDFCQPFTLGQKLQPR
ncbi:inactive rhomboid protein 1-like isoform X2 [Actinia tenebrosa]|uniref:Inactive rhomboid protein 1-like isoform X2 n=1 Tax=Actinia tenebrosa TaxID=6105 RepID=A0A6P8HEM3_ACTTE|nr:inactive rhomboid protein 1-like isoform X2 [Actinia tenebrosa]